MAEIPGNGYPKGKVKEYIARVEEVEADILKAKIAYMNKAGKLRKDISDILDEAKGDGLPKKALRKVIKTRQLEDKADKIREELESEEQDQFDLLRLALGDIEDDTLREAVLARAKEKNAQASDDLDNIGGGNRGKAH